MRNGLVGRNPTHDGLFSMDIDHTRISSPSTGYLEDRVTLLSEDSEKSYVLENVICEDIIPQSSKVVVVDANIYVCGAFEALVGNSILTTFLLVGLLFSLTIYRS